MWRFYKYVKNYIQNHWIHNIIFLLVLSSLVFFINEFLFYYFILVLILLLIVFVVFRKFRIENSKLVLVCAIFTAGLYILFVYTNIPISPLFQGRVEFKMDNIYYKNEYPQIPITIEITGQKTTSSIYLYNKNSSNYLNQIDKLTFETNHRNNSKISGDNSILTGNVFASGKYHIFINTTNSNMTEGYYELVYIRSTDDYEYGNSFYLLKNREGKST